MNLLFYCDEYPPYRTGGIGSVTRIVAEALADRGHNVYVVGYYFKNTELPVYSVINKVHIYRLNQGYRLGLFRKIYLALLSAINLSKIVIQKEVTYTENFIESLAKEKDIDVIELTDYYSCCAYSKTSLSFKKFSRPTVLRIHGCVSFIESFTKGVRSWTKKNDTNHFNRCDYISAVSQSALDYIRQNYKVNSVKDDIVIYNPIENNFLKKQEQSRNKEIIYVGRLTESKGCVTLIKAFNIIAETHPDWTLRIVAGGKDEAYKKMLTPKSCDKVFFMGYCSREQIQLMIDNAAFACVPTYFETFGMVATEIMARSRCLIFTETSSGPEIISNGKDGILVNPRSAVEVSKAMEKLISDPVYRKQLADEAYQKVVSKFVLDKIIVQLENFYSKII